ncbi:hypothetical protein [uncultured Arthrobacter sp.]|uniref:hypothetical protein n=1 Tax=uncultured Arthrobacter sp. TaxID=114050 RepID=UPI0032179264
MVQDEIYYGSQASVEAHDEVTSAAAVARFRTRQDVVRRRGRYGLINENRTPYQAMVEDLMFIRSVLDGAGLDYLLVRGNNHRPVIAVDWKDRKVLRNAEAKRLAFAFIVGASMKLAPALGNAAVAARGGACP